MAQTETLKRQTQAGAQRPISLQKTYTTLLVKDLSAAEGWYGKLLELREYLDTALVERVFGSVAGSAAAE